MSYVKSYVTEDSLLDKLFDWLGFRYHCEAKHLTQQTHQSISDIRDMFRDGRNVRFEDMEGIGLMQPVTLADGVVTRKFFHQEAHLMFFVEIDESSTLGEHYHSDAQEHIAMMHGELLEKQTGDKLYEGEIYTIPTYKVHEIVSRKQKGKSQMIVIFEKE